MPVAIVGNKFDMLENVHMGVFSFQNIILWVYIKGLIEIAGVQKCCRKTDIRLCYIIPGVTVSVFRVND